MKKVCCSIKNKFAHANLLGFSLVEILLAIALFSMIVLALGGTLASSVQNSTNPGRRERAAYLAEEGLEAVRMIRNNDFANLTDGNHGVDVTSGTWAFSGITDTTDIYSRQISISTIDVSTKEAQVTVEWPDAIGVNKTITLTKRFGNIYRTISVVGDWSNPQVQSTLDLSANNDAIDIIVEGNYAYILRLGGGDFIVVDVSNPAAPTLITSIDLPGNPIDFDISGSYAYVVSSDDNNEVISIDISNPAAPATVGSLNLSDKIDPRGIFILDDRAYIGRQGSKKVDEFVIVDISNPGVLSEVGALDLGDSIFRLYTKGSYTYLTTDNNSAELTVIDISNESAPSTIATIDLIGNNSGNTIIGFDDTLIVSQIDGSLYIYDIATPVTPNLLGTFNVGGIINDMSLGNGNNYLFIGSDANPNDLQILDISDPAIPILHGVYDSDDNIDGIDYDATLDRTFCVGRGNTEELIIYQP